MGQPKALLEIDGKPLIQHLVERLEAQGLEPVIVTNAEISIDVLLALPERTVVINPNPEAGRTGSLQCGLLLRRQLRHQGRRAGISTSRGAGGSSWIFRCNTATDDGTGMLCLPSQGRPGRTSTVADA